LTKFTVFTFKRAGSLVSNRNQQKCKHKPSMEW